jgi:hypothetical protein
LPRAIVGLQRDSGTGLATDHVGVREFKVWLQRANLKLATKETKDVFNSVDTYREGKIGFSQFQELYHDLCDVPDITQELDHFSTDVARQTMSAADLVRFYREQYGEELSEVAAASVIRRYGRGGKLKVADFAEFLHGNENEIWNPIRSVPAVRSHTSQAPLACGPSAGGDTQLRTNRATAHLHSCHCVLSLVCALSLVPLRTFTRATAYFHSCHCALSLVPLRTFTRAYFHSCHCALPSTVQFCDHVRD